MTDAVTEPQAPPPARPGCAERIAALGLTIVVAGVLFAVVVLAIAALTL